MNKPVGYLWFESGTQLVEVEKVEQMWEKSWKNGKTPVLPSWAHFVSLDISQSCSPLLRRLTMFLFKAYGIIEIEEKPIIKMAIIRWRINRDEPVKKDGFDMLQDKYPDWTFVVSIEHW